MGNMPSPNNSPSASAHNSSSEDSEDDIIDDSARSHSSDTENDAKSRKRKKSKKKSKKRKKKKKKKADNNSVSVDDALLSIQILSEQIAQIKQLAQQRNVPLDHPDIKQYLDRLNRLKMIARQQIDANDK